MDTIQSMESTALRKAKRKRQELILRLFDQSDLWGAHVVGDAVWAFLHRKNRGEILIDIRKHVHGDSRHISATVQLQKGVRESLYRSCGCRVLQGQPEHEHKRALARTLH